MAKYLISFPSAAMVVPGSERGAVGRDAHAVINEAKAAGVYVFGGGIDEDVPPVLVSADGTVARGGYPWAPTLTVGKVREIATLKLIGAPAVVIAKMIVQQSLALGAIAFAVGIVLIHTLYDRFPHRVVLVPGDKLVLMVIVVGICLLASLVGIRRALAVDPLQALGG